MFEEEAEEYVIKKHNIDIIKQPVDFALRCEFAEDFTDFQKGAEFGYNKANEWHYVKDGDLPKDEFNDEYTNPRLPSAYKRFYCLCLGDDCIMGKYIRGLFHTVEGLYSLKEIVAWKEIVLPKESK